MTNERGLWNRISSFFENIRYSPERVRAYYEIPSDHVEGGVSQSDFQARHHYFQVHVSEMFLAHGRQYWMDYDPVVFAAIEFLYDTQKYVVPQVIGPNLLSQYKRELPSGVRYINTPVSGLHPYIGGDFTLILILYRSRRNDYLRDLLPLFEKIVDVFDPSTALANYMNMAEVILDGLEFILGATESQPVVAVRDNRSAVTRRPFKPGFYALIDAPETNIDHSQLWVQDGHLYKGNAFDSVVPYRENDFVLLSISQSEQRDDFAALPFFPRWREAQGRAAYPETWDKAKAAFQSLWLELLGSPDLTDYDKKNLKDKFQMNLMDLRKEAKQTAEMAVSRGDGSPIVEVGNELQELDEFLKSLD